MSFANVFCHTLQKKSHDYPLCISNSTHPNNDGREKNRENCQADFPYWVDSSCSINHGGRQVDKAHCQGQAREWSSYPKFYDIVENSHIPTGCTVIEPYPFTEELGSCKDSNGYSGGYCSSTTGTWNSATCFRAVWREGVVAVNLPNDGSVCKSIYSEGAAPTNCPPGFSAHAEGNGNGKMAVHVDGSTIVHGDGNANNHCLIPNTETPYAPDVIVTHPFKKSIGGVATNIIILEEAADMKMVDKEILQRNVMHQYTGGQMLRRSNIRGTYVI